MTEEGALPNTFPQALEVSILQAQQQTAGGKQALIHGCQGSSPYSNVTTAYDIFPHL